VAAGVTTWVLLPVGILPEPEGLQAILLQDVEQVFPIGGDSGEEDVTVIGGDFRPDMLSDWAKFFLCGQ